MACESSDVVRFNLGPSFKGRVAKLKSVYNSLIIGLIGVCSVKPTYRKSWTWNLLMCCNLTLGPLLGQTRIARFKSAYNSFIIGPRGLQCETNLQEIMGLEYSDVFRFDLGPSFKVKRG